VASSQNCITLSSFRATPPGYYAVSPLDPLLAEKSTFLPSKLTPWLPTTELRLPSAGNQLPLTDCTAYASTLRKPASAFLWSLLSSLCLVLSGNSFSRILTAPLLQELLNRFYFLELLTSENRFSQSLCVFSK